MAATNPHIGSTGQFEEENTVSDSNSDTDRGFIIKVALLTITYDRDKKIIRLPKRRDAGSSVKYVPKAA